MIRIACVLGLALAFSFSPSDGFAADAKKPGKGEKVCKVKMQYSGETKTWVCKKEEPCCVWHEINYVKCGSTITGCL